MTRREAEAERELRTSQERLRLALEAAQMGTWDWDLLSSRQALSPEAEALLGLAPGSYTGETAQLWSAVFPDDRARVCEIARRALEVGELDLEHRVVWPDGTVRWLASKGRVLRDPDGRAVRMLGVVRDVTARKQAADALRERDQVLATVSHDLKTPLSTIRGQAQLLRRQATRSGGLDLDRALKGLELIETAAVKMTAWIDELLDMARLQAGRPLELRREPTDLVALAWQVAAEQQRATARHRIRVQTHQPRLIGLWDPVRLARALDNLLGNAVKYSPDGGEVSLEVEPETTGDRSWAVVRVRDQGIGIPEADQPHIFERFRRGANVVGRIAGTGIGLAGAWQIVQQHGGSIEVSSQEGRGSTFTVRLPLLVD